jgi:ABC-2 type transport system ATP-binding protein
LENSSAITVEGLTKYYRNFLAVDHIDFQVNQGEIFGFLGPNGAGKTTTVPMVMHRSWDLTSGWRRWRLKKGLGLSPKSQTFMTN